MTFDPDAAAKPGSGVYGLPHTEAEAQVVLLPVPFDATTSYGGGAAHGPEAIRAASAQVDLYDHQFGPVYARGIHMLEPDEAIARDSAAARDLAKPIIEKGGAEPGDPDDERAIGAVDAASTRMNAFVYERTKAILDAGKIPGLVGGDHSTPLGAMRACAEACAGEGFGILQIDAHMDLRDAFEGFTWSHASIMHNALREIPNLERLVMVGIRDYGKGESDSADNSAGRVMAHFDLNWRMRMDRGDRYAALCAEAIEALPERVYISFDIDGLDPGLCPGTGTPVPGGLSFNEACMLLG
ncbi:MAG: arginase family protein, partial [Phycisphaerales bacterium]